MQCQSCGIELDKEDINYLLRFSMRETPFKGELTTEIYCASCCVKEAEWSLFVDAMIAEII